MAIDPKSLTIDYRTLLKNTSISDRVELTKSQSGQQLLSTLTPSQISDLFPDYYKRSNPDVSGFIEATARRYRQTAPGAPKGVGPGQEYTGKAGEAGRTTDVSGLGGVGISERRGRTGTAQAIDPVEQKLKGLGVQLPSESEALGGEQPAGGVLGQLIQRGESRGYNDYNRGNAGDKGPAIDFSQYTLKEVMQMQGQGKVFAVGKYQIIPDTMRNIVNSNYDLNEKFTPELQERLYREGLIKNKRPEIYNYLTGKSDNLEAAQKAMANEWAAVGHPDFGGRSRYQGQAGNRASISVDESAKALQKQREVIAKYRAQGMSEADAYNSGMGVALPDNTSATAKPVLREGVPPEIADKVSRLPSAQRDRWITGINKIIDEKYGGNAQTFGQAFQDMNKVSTTAVGAPATELNLKRPDYWKGTITMEGLKYNFGTGAPGATGEEWKGGSVPKGLFDIRPGLHSGQNPNYRQNSFYVEDMFDPKWGRKRVGVLFHSAADLDNMYTAGCLGVSRDQWPQFRAHMLDMMKRNGPLQVHVDATGNATVFPKGNPPPELRREVAQTGQPINPSDFSASELRQGANNPETLNVDNQNLHPTLGIPLSRTLESGQKANLEVLDESKKTYRYVPETNTTTSTPQTAAPQQTQIPAAQAPAPAQKPYPGFTWNDGTPGQELGKVYTKLGRDKLIEKLKENGAWDSIPDASKRHIQNSDNIDLGKHVFPHIWPNLTDEQKVKIEEESNLKFNKPQKQSEATAAPEQTAAADVTLEPTDTAALGDEFTVNDPSNITATPISDRRDTGGRENMRLYAENKTIDINANEGMSYNSDTNKLKITPEFRNRPEQLAEQRREQTRQEEARQNMAQRPGQQPVGPHTSPQTNQRSDLWGHEKSLAPISHFNTDAFQRMVGVNEKFGFGDHYGYAGINS